MTKPGKAHLIAGTVTAAASCFASAAITTVVAVEAPAETGDALVTSLVVAALGLWRARQIAAPKVKADGDGEPSIGQDPTQRRIDEVLRMVRDHKISSTQGEKLIATLRAHQLPADAPVPPYGTPGGQG